MGLAGAPESKSRIVVRHRAVPLTFPDRNRGNNMKVAFKEWLCDVVLKRYSNNRIAIVLNDVEDGSKVATATINIPSAELADDEVIIKSYSENDWMYECLFGAGVVGPVKRYIKSGYTNNVVCKLLIKQ